MLRYKKQNFPVMQRIRQNLENQRDSNSEENETKLLPDKFYKEVKQIIQQIISSYTQNNPYNYLAECISNLNEFILNNQTYSSEIADFILQFEKDQIFEGSTFLDHIIIFFYIGESEELLMSVLSLCETITNCFPIEYWEKLFAETGFAESLIGMISFPSNGLHLISDENGNLKNITFNDEDAIIAREYIINILFRYLSEMNEKCQTDNDFGELFFVCYNYCLNCIIPCCDSIDKVNHNKEHRYLLFSFLDFILSVFCTNSKHIKLDGSNQLFNDMEICGLQHVIKALSKYVTNSANKDIKVGFDDLAYLVGFVKSLNFLNVKFFLKVFDCFEDEDYRKENQESIVSFLCSAAKSREINLITSMKNVLMMEKGNGPIFLSLLSNPNIKERAQFCSLCSSLIISCFEKQDEDISEQNEPSYQQNDPTCQQNQIAYQQNEPTYQQNEPTYQQNKIAYQQNQPAYQQNEPPYQQIQPTYQQNQPTYQQNQIAYQQNQPAYQQNEFMQQDNLQNPSLNDQILEIGYEWIDFMYDFKIFDLLCETALSDDTFSVKIAAATSLAEISQYLPHQYLSELILDHNFIDIYENLLNSEKETYNAIILALQSILELLEKMTVDANGIELFNKLSESNLLNELEENGRDYDDDSLMETVNMVIQKAILQRNRFT